MIVPDGVALMSDKKRFEGSDHYVATDDLRVAVNAAIALERPLLAGHAQPGRSSGGAVEAAFQAGKGAASCSAKLPWPGVSSGLEGSRIAGSPQHLVDLIKVHFLEQDHFPRIFLQSNGFAFG